MIIVKNKTGIIFTSSTEISNGIISAIGMIDDILDGANAASNPEEMIILLTMIKEFYDLTINPNTLADAVLAARPAGGFTSISQIFNCF